MSTPALYLRTGYVLRDGRRIVSTREPAPERGPVFVLVRSDTHRDWAIRDGLPDALADALDRLARTELPASEFRDPPAHAERYHALVRDHLVESANIREPREFGGPAYTFPDALSTPADVVLIDDERRLSRHFHGWIPGEIAEGRAPVMAVVEDGAPVSVCFCARRSDEAAEAGLETAPAFRERGHALRVTSAWALAVRAMELTPLYSTDWTNDASQSVARRLGLHMYAGVWGLTD